MKHADGLPLPDVAALKDSMARKYGTSMVPWKNLGVTMGFSTKGPYFGCLACGFGEWVVSEKRSDRVLAMQRVLAHVLVCERQPADTPSMETSFDPHGPGVSGVVIGAKGQYALVTGEITDAEGKALHDRMTGEGM